MISKIIALRILRLRDDVSLRAVRMTQKWKKLARLTALAKRGTTTLTREPVSLRAPT